MNHFNKVKIVVSCLEKESADLKIRLKYDGISQSLFFRSIMKLYVNNDVEVLSIVRRIKEENKIMAKQKIKKSILEIEKGEQLLTDLGITETELSDLFDIMESETDE